MKTFDTLYKRTKTGAIQYWKISVAAVTYPTIYKESGQFGTSSPTEHRETVTEGKQKRSPMEQAISQAESDWKKKQDEGYKSRQDLKIDISGDLMHYSVDHVRYNTLTEALNAVLPQFNTDAAGNVKPMLAKAVNWDKVRYPCYVQPKLDGVRCLMVVKDGSIKFLSRNGKEYTTLQHIADSIPQVFSEGVFADGEPAEWILDGEVYSDKLTFQEIIAAVKKQRSDSLKLKFRAYDIVNDANQADRWGFTFRLVDVLRSPHITTVETHMVNSKEDVMSMHNAWVKEGNEGAMIRHLDGMYGQGQRSSDLLKVKEFDDSEFMFVSFEKGQRDEDLIVVCETTNGQLFKAKMVGNREQKEELWNAGHKLSGKQLTVKHFGWTDDGLPRFPIGKAFRDE
jgi:ATP-dependent DNA ligase